MKEIYETTGGICTVVGGYYPETPKACYRGGTTSRGGKEIMAPEPEPEIEGIAVALLTQPIVEE
jgi:hypothetical protein